MLLSHSNLSLNEPNDAWEILVKNSNSALSIVTIQSLGSSCIVELNLEIKVWFPFVVVDDRDLYFVFDIRSLKLDEFVESLVVFASDC